MTIRRTRAAVVPALLALALVAAACGSDDDTGGDTSAPADSTAPDATAAEGGSAAPASTGAVDTVGFIFVGPKDDFGYNQAAYAGSEAVKSAFGDLTVLQAEHVPETAESEAVMQDMIDKADKSAALKEALGQRNVVSVLQHDNQRSSVALSVVAHIRE